MSDSFLLLLNASGYDPSPWRFTCIGQRFEDHAPFGIEGIESAHKTRQVWTYAIVRLFRMSLCRGAKPFDHGRSPSSIVPHILSCFQVDGGGGMAVESENVVWVVDNALRVWCGLCFAHSL